MTKLADLKTKWMKEPEFAAAYAEAEEELRIAEALVKARKDANLTQADVALRMNTKQAAIARLERGDGDPKASTLLRYAAAVGTKLEIRLSPKEPVAAAD
ncbi:helix-turn-helix domain-containing protein [Tepidicaulis sp. LMO-SS28]|uniref:helix-turn-helix domain-containing protein n=1 Tax=Tepidicaulis sp. LMO-SS28 TaxID=3447455 RepID=UPI003EE1E3C5